MLRRGALTVLVAAVVGGATVSAAADEGGGPIAASAGQRTYAKFSSGRQFKPSSLSFGAHELITSISWSKWGKKLAIGRGTYHVNDCVPSCAEGTITPTPATIYLTGRTACGRHFIFKRMKVYFSGHKRISLPFCKR